MKTLYIIRHSKSDWKTGEVDFERGLNKRGKVQAKALGEYFKAHEKPVDLIISSAAKRTVLTSQNIARAIAYPLEDIQQEHSIYEAHYEQYLPVIWGVSNAVDTVVVVGHNPGVTNLVYALTGNYLEFKTSCFAQITFETKQWENIQQHTGTLVSYYAPKKA
ncbi:MAG: histidine phosphatase family protein [Flavobacteriales bacterium]|jgi:phosphohistidine phosphatase|nr:histidine phosphatase family protein [Flavobacteriales bacterium]